MNDVSDERWSEVDLEIVTELEQLGMKDLAAMWSSTCKPEANLKLVSSAPV